MNSLVRRFVNDMCGQTPCGTAVASGSGAKRRGVCHNTQVGGRTCWRPLCPQVQAEQAQPGAVQAVRRGAALESRGATREAGSRLRPEATARQAAGSHRDASCLRQAGARALHRGVGRGRSLGSPELPVCPHSSRAGGEPPDHGGRKLRRLFHRRSITIPQLGPVVWADCRPARASSGPAGSVGRRCRARCDCTAT
jgi:hypothetical protein